MGDGSAIAGWVLAAAVITVLAGGVSAANGSGGSSGSGDSGSAAASRSTAPASRSAAPTCARVTRGTTTDGSHYMVFPVSESGSADCTLKLGDDGRPVTVLQQALLMCSNRAVRVDGTFSKDTSGALVRDQRRQLNLAATGVYTPTTARTMHWPWYDTKSDAFTGRCGQAYARSL